MTNPSSHGAQTEMIVTELRRLRLVPVIVIDDHSGASSLAQALVDGGLPCAEVTFRTKGAREALERIST